MAYRTYRLIGLIVGQGLADQLVLPLLGLAVGLAGDAGYDERHVGGCLLFVGCGKGSRDLDFGLLVNSTETKAVARLRLTAGASYLYSSDLHVGTVG